MSAASCWAAMSSGFAAGLGQRGSGVDAGDPAVELDLGQPGLGRGVGRGLGQDLAVRRSAASRSPVIRASSASSSRGSSGAATEIAAGLEDGVDVLPDLRLGQRTLEALDELPADHRDHHRDALHPQRLGEPRVGVDVDPAEHPGAAALGGELFQRPAQSCWLASLRADQKIQDDRCGHRQFEDVGLEVRLGRRRSRAPAARAGRARGTARGAGRGRPAGCGAGARGLAWPALRSAPRSTAPRVKIDGVVRGSLMVV